MITIISGRFLNEHLVRPGLLPANGPRRRRAQLNVPFRPGRWNFRGSRPVPSPDRGKEQSPEQDGDARLPDSLRHYEI